MKVAQSYHFNGNFWNNREELSKEDIEDMKNILRDEFENDERPTNRNPGK